MDLREIVLGGMEWIDLTQNREQWRAFVSTVIKFWGSQKCSEILE
jgi:hypothetical protein